MIDKKRGTLNVTVSILFKLLLFIGGIVVKRFLIQNIGNDVNGLNSLYLSIIGFLSVAELGAGSAIIFCMYKPIVNGESEKVSALYHLFRRLYLIIGGVIFAAGLLVMPFLKFLAKDYAEIDVNMYSTFFLMLVSVYITYLFSAKTSLINAYKNDYITTTITSLGQILQYALQIVVILITKSFVWYLACRIVAVGLQWLATNIVTKRKYFHIVSVKSKIDTQTRSEVTKNVKAMFMHKIGGVLVNTVDSLLISAFFGVVILGKYSNYITIMVAMVGILELCFTSLTSVVGHTYAQEAPEKVIKYFKSFHNFNLILGTVFFLGYYAVIDSLITFCFGEGLLLEKAISFTITLNYFVQFVRRSVCLFKDAAGIFYNDRWKSIIEGLINLALSILLEAFLGVVGVIVATIVTNLLICHIVEPHVLYKYAFKKSAKGYYLKNYLYILLFTGLLLLLNAVMVSFGNLWLEILVNGCIAVGIAIVPCVAILLADGQYKTYIAKLKRKLKR